MGHKHVWTPLKGHIIEVVVSVYDSTRAARSFYMINQVCEDKACYAGRTNDRVIVPDVRIGRALFETREISIGKVRSVSKES